MREHYFLVNEPYDTIRYDTIEEINVDSLTTFTITIPMLCLFSLTISW